MKYEHKVITRFDLEHDTTKGSYPYFIGMEISLDKLSEEGWELVAIYEERFIFKRELK